jgi:hypothetical protein
MKENVRVSKAEMESAMVEDAAVLNVDSGLQRAQDEGCYEEAPS